MGYQSGTKSINKDYVQIAMNNLNNEKSTPELRKWSIEVLNKLSPIPMDSSLKKELSVVMGPLEIGTNRQGNDFNAYGFSAMNAQICAEICRKDERCDAMTYVESLKTCWPKRGVPNTSPNPDMISAVKIRY